MTSFTDDFRILSLFRRSRDRRHYQGRLYEPQKVQSALPIPPISGLTKSSGIRKSAELGVIYNLQNPYLGLGNGRGYWGETVLGGAVWGGGCIPMCHIEKYSHLLPFCDCQLVVYCSYSHCRVVRMFVV